MKSRFAIIAILTILLVAATLSLAQASRPDPRPISELMERLPQPQDRGMLRAGKAKLEPALRAEKANSPHAFDVLHYEINMDIDIPGDTVRAASVYLDCRSETDTLSAVDLDFQGMNIDSITVDWELANYTWEPDQLHILLGSTVSQGDSFRVAIHYHGRPYTGGGGLTIDEDVTFTMCEPEGARNWYPCYDKPSDKATADMIITVPEDYIVASNGLLVQVKSDPGTKTVTYHWSEKYPIATYLVSLAISRYAEFSYWYYHDQDSMEIACFAPKAESTRAAMDFANLPDMIACYNGLFGIYPFIEEKYGMATFPWGGAMEHQTCTSWGFPLPGNQYYDWVVAHELAHQWWGDWLSPDDWRDIWLNEGFATYSEALWMEYRYGAVGLQAYMAEMQDYYVWYEEYTGRSFPIYDPPPGYLFSATEYEKGGCVLHMLRFVVGDSTFFDILRTYGTDYAYGSVVTDDFQDVCEDLSGQDLNWFFEQWIYQAGFPEYSFAWNMEESKDKGYLVNVAITQMQAGTIFNMPVELKITTVAGEILDTVTVDDGAEQLQFQIDDEPLSVQLDPDHWLLCQKEEVQVTEPILVLMEWDIDDDLGDQNGWISPGETVDFVVALENQGITACGITGILRTDDQTVQIMDSTANFEEIRFYQTGDNSLTPFTISSPAGGSPHWADFTLVIRSGGTYEEHIDIRLPIGDPVIMLVDDDGGNEADQFYTDLLDSLGYIYDLYDTDKAGASEKVFGQFDLVIWFAGSEETGTLSAADQDSLAAYLDGGGALLISGSGLGNDIGETSFYNNYLHTSWDGETSSTLLQGVAGDPISGGSLVVILNQDGKQDVLAPQEDAGTSPCFNYLGDGVAAVRHESIHKVLYFGYGLESIRGDNPSALDAYELMDRILSWFQVSTSVELEEFSGPALPNVFHLTQNYPNPFNPATRILFQVPDRGRVALRVFNIRGQEVRGLLDEQVNAGPHTVLWDGRDDRGRPVASGIYFCQMRAGEYVKTVKMLLMR